MPLALRAMLVNGASGAGDPGERRVYEGLKRAMLAPQGIGVLDSSGRPLVWTQLFRDRKGVLEFFDHALKRYAEPARSAECYMTFPGNRVKEVGHEAAPEAVPDGHPKGAACPARHAKGRTPPGSLAARLVGRALDGEGKPVADTVNQEHYAEDQFAVPPAIQEAVARALADGGRLPDEFARLCAGHAFLGHIDVGPFLPTNRGEWKKCELRGRKVGPSLFRVEGESEVAGEVKTNGPGVHDIKLAWEGFIELKENRVARFVLSARGTEKLQFAKDRHPLRTGEKEEVAVLPGGRPIDLEGGVRYGIVAEPAPAEEAAPAPEEGGSSLEKKMRRVRQGVAKWQGEGKDPSPIGRILERFEPLMREGRRAEAEAVLDEALKRLEEN